MWQPFHLGCFCCYWYTDKGILMTFGSGVNGCLGHGDFDDVAEVGHMTVT